MLGFEVRINSDISQTKTIASFNCVASFYDLTYKIRKTGDRSDTHLFFEVENTETEHWSLIKIRDLHHNLWDLMTSADLRHNTLETFYKNGLNYLSKHGVEIGLDEKKFMPIQKPRSKSVNNIFENTKVTKFTSDVDGFFLGIDITKPAIQTKVSKKQIKVFISENLAASIAETAAECPLRMRLIDSNSDSSATLAVDSELAIMEMLCLIMSKTHEKLLEDARYNSRRTPA
jgi:hypothetical protein